MNLLKLSQKGIAHYIMPLVVIAAVGSVGTLVLVRGHAQTPPPESSKGLSCSISAPASIKAGQTLAATVIVRNSSNSTFNITPSRTTRYMRNGHQEGNTAGGARSFTIGAATTKSFAMDHALTDPSDKGIVLALSVALRSPSNNAADCSKQVPVN